MADLIAMGRKVVMGNSPYANHTPQRHPLRTSELATVPSLCLGRAFQKDTFFGIRSIFSLKIVSAFCHLLSPHL